ncbi:cysteine proteinase [Phlegmacium glaucopus]|nr:cysteine proteinase [Phlegmacium glaucopus]
MSLLISVLKSTLFQQIAPFIVLFVIPALFFFGAVHLRRIYYNFTMGIESWGFSLPWLWSSSQTGTSSPVSHRKSKRKSSQSGATGSRSKSKAPKTRAEQVALNVVRHSDASESEWESAQYYPGLVNISGTYCFMNSTLQALASLTYLQPQIDAIHAKAEHLDVPTPVIDALHELFNDLNTPKSSYHSLRPHAIINALSSPTPPPAASSASSNYHRPITSTTLFNSREHQDAQELFQLVSECIKNEMGAVEKEGLRDRGIAAVLDFGHRESGSASKRMNEKSSFPETSNSLTTKSVFDGLTANRRSCVTCGYTEAVMHFGFDNWQLAMPRLATSCRLEDCLEDYTRLEILKDCVCRKCSVLATHRRLLQDLKALEEALDLVPQSSTTTIPPHTSSSSKTNSSTAGSSLSASTATVSSSKPKPSASKKRRYKEVKRMEQSVRTALSQGRIEDEDLLAGVRLERVVSPASTKQAMIARPPPVLALHLNRSVHYGQFASKNTIKVHFPEVLDLTPYTTSGSLSTVPTSAISTPSPPPSLQAPPPAPSSSFSSSSSYTEHRSQRRSKTPTPDNYRSSSSSFSPSPAPETQRTIYRLTAVVCHYGQHSFGHYICYRRKPRMGKDKRNLAGEVPVLVGPERGYEEETEEEENDSRGRSRSKSEAKDITTNGFANSYSVYSHFTPQPPPPSSFHWQDRSETLSGSGKGWLRISDDSVGECGIESVLAEGSGVFMLYYERAVWGGGRVDLRTKEGGKMPVNGVLVNQMGRLDETGDLYEDGDVDVDVDGDGDGDADRFSIGSEETLRPKMKVVDFNGSVGSLVSEVGVGIMRQKKDGVHHGKEGHGSKAKYMTRDGESPMSLSMNANLYASSVSLSSPAMSSKIFGPRIVRSVNARRGHSVGTNGSAIPGSEMVNGVGPLINGITKHGAGVDQEQRDGYDAEDVTCDMTASAPSILQIPKLTNNSSSSIAIGKISSQMGLGSKSTRTMQHAPTTTNPVGMKVKAP